MTSDHVATKSPKVPRSVANVARWITLCLSDRPMHPPKGIVPPLKTIKLVPRDPGDETAGHC
jgi:hypothetical protein